MLNHPSSEITIRPAVRGDDRSIRAMVRREHLNPLGVDWRNFFVAVNSGWRIVGIGAVKTHGDGSRELASIATDPDWRDQGVAGAVIRTILEREDGPLYLTCRETMAGFYERFGFEEIGREKMPPYFRRLHVIFSIIITAGGSRFQLKVLKRGKKP
jgi:N-acetylglutamate synthase-like GNAT family acetyltransferase